MISNDNGDGWSGKTVSSEATAGAPSLLFLVVDQLFLDFKNIWDTTIKGREVSYDPQIFEFLTC